MKRLLFALALLLFSIGSNAQFTNGQVLTAPALNAALAAPTITGGSINNAPIGSLTPNTGKFTNLSVTGSFTPGAGSIALTSLATQAANTVVANFTASIASPVAFAMPSCSTGSSALQYTNGTGFTCTTTLNAATLEGFTFESPGTLGSTTPNSASVTTLNASGITNITNGTSSSGSTNGALVVTGGVGVGNNVFVAGSVVAGGGFTGPLSGAVSATTLSASGAVSGTGFTNLFASPPPVGTTTAAAGKFTTLNATSNIVTTQAGNTEFIANDTSGSNTAGLNLENNSNIRWYLHNSSGSSDTFSLDRYSGASVFQDSPIIVLNSTGNVTFTDAIVPNTTKGIVGTTAGDQANAGSVGEVISSLGGSGGISSAINTNLASIAITPGDWDVVCEASYTPNAGTTLSGYAATVTNISSGSIVFEQSTLIGGTSATSGFAPEIISSPPVRFNVTSTTTAYCTGITVFSGGTLTAQGFIRARRIR